MAKKVSDLLIVLALGVCWLLVGPAASAAAETESAQAAREGAPKIEIPEALFDFGVISQNSTVTHTFKVRNAGDAPLQLLNAKASCGCTAAVLSNEPIPPGGEGEVKVSFKPGRRRGDQKKTVTVTSNDEQTPRTQLYIMANVVVPFGFASANIGFGRSFLDKGDSRLTALTANDPSFIDGVEFSSSSDLVGVQVMGEPEIEAESVRLPLKVEISPEMPVGRYKATITAKSAIDTLAEATLQISGLVVGKVEANPMEVSFLMMHEAGNAMVPEYQRVQILNHDSERPLKVTDFEDLNRNVELSLDTATEGEQYTLTIRPKPIETLTEPIEGMIVVHTDNPLMPELQVAYSIRPEI